MTCLKGLEVNTNIDGRLPLHYASDYGQLEVIKFLCGKVTDPVPTSLSPHVSLSLLQGAKVNEEDKHGITPLLAAVWEGHTACVKFLLENVREILMQLIFIILIFLSVRGPRGTAKLLTALPM